jgi:hypothetical protein
VLSVRRPDGWFAAVEAGDHAHCQGVSGPGARLQTDQAALHVRAPFVIHTWDTATHRLEYGSDPLARREVATKESVGFLRVCRTDGPAPHCTEPLIIACPASAGTSGTGALARGRWSLEGGELVIEAPAPFIDPDFVPDDEHQAPERMPACDSVQVSAGRFALP